MGNIEDSFETREPHRLGEWLKRRSPASGLRLRSLGNGRYRATVTHNISEHPFLVKSLRRFDTRYVTWNGAVVRKTHALAAGLLLLVFTCNALLAMSGTDIWQIIGNFVWK